MEPAGFRVFTKLTRAHYLRQQMQGPEWRGVAWRGWDVVLDSCRQNNPVPCRIALFVILIGKSIPGISQAFLGVLIARILIAAR